MNELAEAVEEIVDLGVDPAKDLPCSGVILQPLMEPEYLEECNQPARWRKTVAHCGVRSRFRCQEHFEAAQSRDTCCLKCGACPIDVVWTRL